MSIDKTNKQQLQAYELIETTNSSFFLTGKAGTGKTTFLQTVQKEIDKKKPLKGHQRLKGGANNL